jgi:ADP-heptose:LPS heptosyltransferase
VSLQEVFFNDTIYDVVIDTEQWHYLSALTAYLARSSYKIGFATRPQRAKLFHKAVKYDVDGYELDNFWRLFVILSETKDLNDRESKESHQLKVEGSFSINAHAQAWAKEQIPDNFVAVFLGASIVLRRLNEGQIMTIVNYYLRKNCTIVLLGGKDVKSFAQGITTKIVNSLPLCGEGKGEGNKIFNYAGQLSLMQSAALIQRSSLFIGPDSGFLHLACAINTPVIGIFGPGNLVKWAPKGEKHRVITENAACSPCTRFGYTLPTCNGSYHCMKNIKIRQFDVIPAKAGIHNRINSSLNEKL